MTVSELATGSIPHNNKYNARDGTPISRVVVHHWAGTAGGDMRLADPNAQASANYLIYTDGTIVSQVPEEYRAWTSGGFPIDAPSITVEVQNSSNAPNWEVSTAAITALTALIADIAARYGWDSIDRSRVRGHQEFSATACPGPYLYPRLSNIAAAAAVFTKQEEDPMPQVSQSSYKGAQKVGQGWTTLKVHSKGYISLMQGGSRARRARGLVNLAVSGGAVDVRVVRAVTNAAGDKVSSVHTLPFKTLSPGYGDYAFGLDLPSGATNRLRLQVRARGKSAQVDNVQASLDWWDL